MGIAYKCLQYAEAVRRLEILQKKGLMKEVLENYKKPEQDISIFERQSKNLPAILYSLELNRELQEYKELGMKIVEFEKEHNAVVYLVQLTHFTFGDCYSFLYVSEEQNEWEFDRDDLENNQAFVYVWNKSDDECSEFGSIAFDIAMGGIVRTA